MLHVQKKLTIKQSEEEGKSVQSEHLQRLLYDSFIALTGKQVNITKEYFL